MNTNQNKIGFATRLLLMGGLLLGSSFASLAAEPSDSTQVNSPTVSTNTIAGAFSTMETLDNLYTLSRGDRLSFRIIEDQVDTMDPLEPKPLMVTDSGELELPYIGRFPAEGKSCKQLASEIKVQLEKDYYYQATVIIAVDLKARSSGKVYVSGQVKMTGPVEIPSDEVLTLSKAVLRTGGFTEYSDKRHVKVTRRVQDAAGGNKSFIVDLSEVLEKGKSDKDIKLESGDAIFVPSRLLTF